MIANILFYISSLSCFLLPIVLYKLVKKRYSISFNKEGLSKQILASIKYMSIIGTAWCLYLYFILYLFFAKLSIDIITSIILVILSIAIMAVITGFVNRYAIKSSQKKLIYLIEREYLKDEKDVINIFVVIKTFLYGIFSYVIIGIFIAGFIYFIYFSSLIWLISKQNNFNPIDIMLFYKIPTHINIGFLNSFLMEFSIEPKPIYYPLGLLYGIYCITVSLIYNQIKYRNAIRLYIFGGGIILGFYLTLCFCGNLLGIIRLNLWKEEMLYFRVIYLLLLFDISECMKLSLKRFGMFKKKYELIIDGFYGILSTIILIHGFEENELSILTGPIFLIFVFLGIGIVESTYGRYLYARYVNPNILFDIRNRIRGTKIKNKLHILIEYYKKYGAEYNKIEDIGSTEIKEKWEYIIKIPTLSILFICFTTIAMLLIIPIYIIKIYFIIKWIFITAVAYGKYAINLLAGILTI